MSKNIGGSASHWHEKCNVIDAVRGREKSRCNVPVVIDTRATLGSYFIRPFSFSRREINVHAVCEQQPQVGHERAGAERQSSSMSVVRIVSRLSLRSYPGPF